MTVKGDASCLLHECTDARLLGFQGHVIGNQNNCPGAHLGYVWWLGKEGKACGEEVVTAVN